MNIRSQPAPARSVPDTSTVWFLSFGDLLTLLLCFFLILTRQHGLPIDKASTQQEIVRAPGAVSSAGTQIASQDREVARVPSAGVPITVPLEEVHSSQAVEKAFLAGWNVLHGRIGSEPRDVTVTLCDGQHVEELMDSVYRERLSQLSRVRSLKVHMTATCESYSMGLSSKRELVAVLDYSKV